MSSMVALTGLSRCEHGRFDGIIAVCPLARSSHPCLPSASVVQEEQRVMLFFQMTRCQMTQR